MLVCKPQYFGKEFQSCVDNTQCPCAGTRCALAEEAKRQTSASWCVVTNSSVDPAIRYGSKPPSITPVPPPVDADLLQRPGCTASMLPPTAATTRTTTTATTTTTTTVPGQTTTTTTTNMVVDPSTTTTTSAGGSTSTTPSPSTTTSTATSTLAAGCASGCGYGMRCNSVGSACEAIPACSVAERGRDCAVAGQVCQGSNGIYACTSTPTPACSANAPTGRCEGAGLTCKLDSTTNQHVCASASGAASPCGQSNPQGACPTGRVCRSTPSGQFQCELQCTTANCAAPFACDATTDRCVPPGLTPSATCEGVPIGTRTTVVGVQEKSCLCAPGALLICDTDPFACNLISDATSCAAATPSGKCCFNAGASLCLDTAASGAAACSATVAPTASPTPTIMCTNGMCANAQLQCHAASNRCLPADIGGAASGDCNGLAVGARTQANGKECICANGDVLLCFESADACGLLLAEGCAARSADCCFRATFGVCAPSMGRACVDINNVDNGETKASSTETETVVVADSASEQVISIAVVVVVIALMTVFLV